MEDIQEITQNAIIWVNTLLSTEEKQGQGTLGNSFSGYCCLGLGCKTLEVPFDSFNTQSDEFATTVGLYGSLGEPMSDEYTLKDLAALNDEYQYGFHEIGEHLIEFVDSYFKPDIAKGIKEHFKTK